MSDIELLFQQIKVSSCNCCTKAPDAKYHDEHCRYRLICELETKAQEEIEQLKAVVEAASSMRDEVQIMLCRSAEKQVFNRGNVLEERMLFDKSLNNLKQHNKEQDGK